MKSKSKNDYIELLDSNNPIIIKETLNEIRLNGNINILPSLLNLVKKYKNEEIGYITINILKDIKLTTFKEILINEINNPQYLNIKTTLLSICWESSLDFSDYIFTFAKIVIQDNFTNSFEAYTIIKNFNNPLNIEITKKTIDYFKSNLNSIESQKKELVHDLIVFLNNRLS